MLGIMALELLQHRTREICPGCSQDPEFLQALSSPWSSVNTSAEAYCKLVQSSLISSRESLQVIEVLQGRTRRILHRLCPRRHPWQASSSPCLGAHASTPAWKPTLSQPSIPGAIPSRSSLRIISNKELLRG